MRVLVALFIIASCVILPLPTQAQDESVPRFEMAPCMVEVPENLREGEDIQCGYLTVPEVHADPTGPTIRLAVAILISTSPSPASDPLFMAQGGPGGSTLSYFVPSMAGALGTAIRERRDIVLLEQRGTYYSEPSLMCEETFNLTLDLLDEDVSAREVDERGGIALAECHTRLVGEGVNLAAYNSLESAADIEDLRQVLGYGPINFYGVSYGTALAQHLMRDYAGSLRSVTLDAVSPLSVDYLPDVRANSQRAFDELFAVCAADVDCHTAYPDLETTFYDLAAQLDENPVPFAITDPDTGDEYQVLLNGDGFVNLMFNFMYVNDLIPRMPQIVYSIRDGDYALLSQITPYLVLQRTMSRGMYYSVLCSEDSDLSPQALAPANVNPRFEAAFGDLDVMLANCAAWGVPALDAMVDDPVVSDIPTLVLSGVFDPVTPPAYGDLVAASLSNAYAYTLPNAAHGVFETECGSTIAMQFLTDPQTEPDASCLAEMRVDFRLPTTRYTDPEGLFTVSMPYGWTAEFLDGPIRTVIVDSATDSRIMIMIQDSTGDTQGLIQAFVEALVQADDIEPARVNELDLPNGIWTQMVYVFSDGILIAVGIEHEDQIYVIATVTTQDTLDGVIQALNDVVPSLTFGE